ncbi:MarR family EPS-associated transcriptional regulator [Qipengyuania flava]|uniref:MarR family EPS-associated transcriptional regulator n=1 Tax=Qipengyuania flava TaxID=192812 RepID=UPI000B8C2654|nr:MarR family EPS-associated transcriptional regulator [Qipengyuania flava]ASP31060.1 MarR family EPS-associated transcriptional regulator [Qipengyuania flava]
MQPHFRQTTPDSEAVLLSEREAADWELLDLIDRYPGLSQRDLAARMGISLGRVNYCLKALAGKGMVKAGNFARSDTKGRYLYALTPRGIAQRSALTGAFLKRKMAEYERLKAQIDRLEQQVKRGDP